MDNETLLELPRVFNCFPASFDATTVYKIYICCIQKNKKMERLVLKIFGILPLLVVGDSAVFDRWLWLVRNLGKRTFRVLDAGCGSGAFTMYAAKVCSQATGISFDERNNKVAIKRAGILGLKNITFIQGDLRELDTIEGLEKFDQVISCETIEHIKNDQKLLVDIARLLKTGGKLFLTTPYKFYHHLPGDDISEVEDGGHMRWGYTHEEMKVLFEYAGMKLEKADYVTGFISQSIIRLERILGSFLPHRIAWFLTFPLRLLVVFDPLVTRMFRYPHLSIAVVGVKQ